MIKSKKDILEELFNSALTQNLEHQINLKRMERQGLVVSPGKEYDELSKMIQTKKMLLKVTGEILEIIQGMLKEEGEKKNG